ncbi:hypothetical protein [Streptomyces sp. NPDC047141]
MTTPLPSDTGVPPEFGVPSPELTARAASGFEKFLARTEDDDQAGEVTAQ